MLLLLLLLYTLLLLELQVLLLYLLNLLRLQKMGLAGHPRVGNSLIGHHRGKSRGWQTAMQRGHQAVLESCCGLLMRPLLEVSSHGIVLVRDHPQPVALAIHR